MRRIISIISLLLFCSTQIFGNSIHRAKMAPVNPNVDDTTRSVFSYICDTYGNKVISGQQESTWVDGTEYEMNYLESVTGKLPAMRGFDFINDDFDGVVKRATEWWNRGGLVTICWHCGPDFSEDYTACREKEITDWKAVLTVGTPENDAFIKNMDKAGRALLELQNRGVTVLWRPFHEFDGAWFWWGKGGPDNFKKLWKMMYNHFTNDLGLNNLLWVLGYSHNGYQYKGDPTQWYVGDDFCDIVGADTYEVGENKAEKRLYRTVQHITKGNKPLIMHECGLIPMEQDLKEVPWASFMTWHTEYLIDENSQYHLKTLYNSKYVITLDELPSFR